MANNEESQPLLDLEDDMNLVNLLESSDLDNDNNEPTMILNSPYYDDTGFSTLFKKKRNSFSIISLNCQSINSKFEQLRLYIEQYNTDDHVISAICLQETWLTADSDLTLLQLEGYNLISSPRSCSAHSGVAIYLHESFNYKIINCNRESAIFDYQIIEIIFNNNCQVNKKVNILNLYRPPRQTVENIETFTDELNSILNDFRNNKEVLVCGDFNIDLLKHKVNYHINDFFEMMIANGYLPSITLPTRLTYHTGTLIDNIFIKITDNHSHTTSGILLSQLSDHLPYFVMIDHFVQDKPKSKYVKFMVKNENALNRFKEALIKQNLMQTLSPLTGNPNRSYNKFKEIIDKLMTEHLPVKQVRYNKYKHKKNKWITKGILKSISFRDKLYTKLQNTPVHHELFETYKTNLKTYNRILKQSLRIAKKDYYCNHFETFKCDIKKTWETINEIMNKNKSSSFPEYFLVNGHRTTDHTIIANEFNKYFTNIGINLAEQINSPHNRSFIDYLNSPSSHNFKFELINADIVIKTIDSLKPKTSYGHDRITNKLLKFTKDQLAEPLAFIINQSIEEGIFPDKLNIAKVLPLYKKNDKFVFDNYRPISILPSVSKVFERIIHNQIYEYFSKHELFYKSQYGFRQNHSTELAAIELIDRIIKQMDINCVPINIFLDLSKAFDTLDHNILLHKLRYYGINGKSLELLDSYLKNRFQFVEFQNTNSDYLELKCGVPQGSILGPLLFIIYVNDLNVATTHLHPLIYADDTTLCTNLTSFQNNSNLEIVLNSELDSVNTWLKLNKLSLNISKTRAIQFHNPQRNVVYPSLYIERHKIDFVSEFNFLGIIIDSHLKWKSHIDMVSKKISKTIGILNKLKNFLPTSAMMNIYNSLILSHLSYGLLIWGWKSHKLYKLQKKAIRIVTKSNYASHTSVLFKKVRTLKIMDLCALQDLKLVYKFENNLVPNYLLNIVNEESTHDHFTRHSSGVRFRLPAVRHDFAKNGIAYRLPKIWNSMDPTIKGKIRTHSLYGYKFYIKEKYLQTYATECNILNCYICNR